MRTALLSFLLLIPAVTPAFADQIPTQQSHQELLAKTQAADVLSDLLTWHARRLEARLATMASYLKDTGKLTEYSKNPPPTTRPSDSLYYDQVFTGAIQFVNKGGDKYADPVLKTLTDDQLQQEFIALQEYNIQEFSYVNQQRQATATARAYLEKAGLFSDYITYAQSHAQPDLTPGTTRPSNMSPEEFIVWQQKLIDATKDAEWKRAQAKGISQADFEKQWDQKVADLKTDVAKRVQGMQALAAAFQQSPPAPPTENGDESPSASASTPLDFTPPPQASPDNPQLAPTWNAWTDRYPDAVLENYRGPGLYGSYDTRVNDYNDRRLEGEYDRRRDLDFDRRTNVNINIRRGF